MTISSHSGSETSAPKLRELFSSPLMLAAFGLGSGLLPFAPGTWGTLLGIGFYYLFAPLGGIVFLVVIVLLFLLGIYLCGEAARRLGVHDHSGIVWDEIVGFMVTMLPVTPLFSWHFFWPALGFILFRLFDIMKPLGIRWLDRRVAGGLGIMLDDLLAGVYAGFCLGVVYWSVGWFV
jgi:phosphatidylglycerophosphatase A